jgi:hypothetical protein
MVFLQEFHRRFHRSANLIWFGSWIKGTAYHAVRNCLDDFPTLYHTDLADIKQASDLVT